MENREVARILRETAQLLEIDGAMYNRFRSYERAGFVAQGEVMTPAGAALLMMRRRQ